VSHQHLPEIPISRWCFRVVRSQLGALPGLAEGTLTVGLDDFRDLLQHYWFYDSKMASPTFKGLQTTMCPRRGSESPAAHSARQPEQCPRSGTGRWRQLGIKTPQPAARHAHGRNTLHLCQPPRHPGRHAGDPTRRLHRGGDATSRRGRRRRCHRTLIWIGGDSRLLDKHVQIKRLCVLIALAISLTAKSLLKGIWNQ